MVGRAPEYLGKKLEQKEVKMAMLAVIVTSASILVFSAVAIFSPNWFWLVVSRLLGVPVIAGIGYEWIRLMARNRYNPVVKVMLLPVLGTQEFTTREPDADQMEVAIAAFNAAREGEKAEEAA